MMLIFRLVLSYFHSQWVVKTNIDQELVASFRVMPTNLDFNGHMTNHRYHAVMDYATVQLLGSHGILESYPRWSKIAGDQLSVVR